MPYSHTGMVFGSFRSVFQDYLTDLQAEKAAQVDVEDEDTAPVPQTSRRGAVSAAVMVWDLPCYHPHVYPYSF
jgi:hypothetical protein